MLIDSLVSFVPYQAPLSLVGGAGVAIPSTVIDLLGQARHDDPAITNTGTGYPVFAQSSPGSSVLPSGDTSLNLSASGGVTTYTFQGGFTFSLYGVNYTSVIVSSQGYLQFAADHNVVVGRRHCSYG